MAFRAEAKDVLANGHGNGRERWRVRAICPCTRRRQRRRDHRLAERRAIWDPNQRFTPDAQPIFKAVFDQPLDQDPQLKLIPHLIKAWNLAPDALSMAVELRDDVTFHNGDKMTTEDFRYTFLERIKSGLKLDIANSMKKVDDIVIESPTKATMKFSSPAPTMPQWMAFLGSYVVPKNYIESKGLDNFLKKPVGTGPYKLAEYELNSRIVLERNDNYWGPKAKVARVTIQIIKDPSARVAAIQSGQVDCTLNVPVREVQRFQQEAGFAAEINPITRVILINVRADLAFADKNVRLAAHHAIDKAALSKAFYGGAAVPLSVLATPGTPGYLSDFTFKYDPALAKQLLAKSGLHARQTGEDRLRHHQRPVPQRLRHRARHRRRCGSRSASMPTCRSSNTPNISSSIAATNCRRRRSIAGTMRPAIRRSSPAISSTRKCRSRRGRTRISATGCWRCSTSPTMTSGLPATAIWNATRSKTARPCLCCKAW